MNNTTNNLVQNDQFIKDTFKKALFPCLLSVLSANINVIVDGIIVGKKLGENALAAINLCLPIYLFMCVIGSFVASGTAINASKAMGNRTDNSSNEYYKLSVISSFILALAFTICGFILINPIINFLCSDNLIRPYVYEYTYITISGAIPKIMIYIPFWYLRLDGKNREISYMMSILALGNIILDVVLVYLLDYRVLGAAMASVIATAFAFAYGFACLMDENSSFKFSLKLNLSEISIKNIISAGIPSSFNNLCATLRILIINSMLINIGGAIQVAIFTAINGVFGIGEAIVLGIPQAGTAMLGVYSGERDNSSCGIIIKSEMVLGIICTGIFSVIVICFSPILNRLYGIDQSIVLPVIWMCLSIYPALVCNIMSSYYNILGKNWLSVLIIILRVLVMTYLGLVFVSKLSLSLFMFLPFAEIATLIVLYCVSGYIYHRDNDLHRYMLCNMKHEKDGKIVNFSIENNPVKICEGCELIIDFCAGNGMSPKETMKIQLAMEEVMTLLNDVNKKDPAELRSFDLRAFNVGEVIGIRIRYGGIDFNPFSNINESLEYMGIRMVNDLLETVTYQRTFGVNTLILLLKENINGQSKAC